MADEDEPCKNCATFAQRSEMYRLRTLELKALCAKLRKEVTDAKAQAGYNKQKALAEQAKEMALMQAQLAAREEECALLRKQVAALDKKRAELERSYEAAKEDKRACTAEIAHLNQRLLADEMPAAFRDTLFQNQCYKVALKTLQERVNEQDTLLKTKGGGSGSV